MPGIELRIVPADTFSYHVQEIRTDLSVPGTEILGALVQKITELAQYDWHESAPAEFYSVYRNGYGCRFHRDYVFTFEREVTESSAGSAKIIILWLKTIQRA